MKTAFLFVGLIALGGATPKASANAEKKFEILESCEGEGCGCTKKNVTNEKFVIYAEMDTKSKILGKFGSGTKAYPGKLRTRVIKPGKAQVIEVKDPKIGLKVGDVVTHIFNAGEGNTEVKLKNDWIQFEDDEAKLKVIEDPNFEPWLEITVGNIHGYTNGFPFEGCLE